MIKGSTLTASHEVLYFLGRRYSRLTQERGTNDSVKETKLEHKKTQLRMIDSLTGESKIHAGM